MSDKDRFKEELFCVCCLREGAVCDAWCDNCGAGGSIFPIPRWAVKSIQEQASWVGKRFFPIEEDLERAAELNFLRRHYATTSDTLPGREVEKDQEWRGRATVSQVFPDGRRISVSVGAEPDETEIGILKRTADCLPVAPLEWMKDVKRRA